MPRYGRDNSLANWRRVNPADGALAALAGVHVYELRVPGAVCRYSASGPRNCLVFSDDHESSWWLIESVLPEEAAAIADLGARTPSEVRELQENLRRGVVQYDELDQLRARVRARRLL